MYTVKKLEKNEIFKTVKLSDSKTLNHQIKGRRSYAIVDESGEVLKRNGHHEIYPQRSTAQAQADWLNRNA